MLELEKLLVEIRHAGMIQLDYDMWDQHGREHATPEKIATMEADLAQANQARTAATIALEALVATTRTRAPGEITAWADAHDAYLAAFLADCVAKGEADGTAADVATRERSQWAEVRQGTRAFVDENLFYVTQDTERYRSLFGIDP
jgi:hypothetical protein